jgi:hypothetical protein
MRKFFIALAASLLSCSATFAFWPEGAESSLDIGIGYRQDDFKYEGKGNTTDGLGIFNLGSEFGVTLEDEFRIKDIKLWEINTKWKYITCDNLYFRGRVDYGWLNRARHHHHVGAVVFGNTTNANEDFSFDRDHSLQDVRHKVRHGHVYDVILALGYQFKMCDDTFAISPVIGYSWHGQRYEFKKHHHHSTDCETTGADFGTEVTGCLCSTFLSSPLNCDSSCDSSNGHHKHHTFRKRWFGPLIGLDLDYRFACDWTLFAGYEYHWARYTARGGSNLRPLSLEGFKQYARRTHGHVFDLGIKWDLDCWTIGISGHWQYWRAKRGTDCSMILEESFGNVEQECMLKTPLKKVTWRSAVVSIDLGLMF